MGQKYSESGEGMNDYDYYTPRQGEEANENNNVSPLANAGFLSVMSFWWLNSLMKKGKQDTLDEEDIPQLPPANQAETCYNLFIEQSKKRKIENSSQSHSVLSTILFCQRKAILISGFFALVKTLTLSTGPLFLYALIKVAEGKDAFKLKGYVLAAGLFLAKILESMSERQWWFRTKVIGLQVKSLLTAAAYWKQLHLSNPAKMTHSAGQIMNYVAIDAHKIGEFPFWFHQLWTIGLQVCIALFIVYYSVGLATIVALFVIILAAIGNSPLSKLQIKYLKKFMVAQDRRLEGMTEALINMKVLKLYSWERHFMNAAQGLREEEIKWLLAVQLQKGYNIILYYSTTILVSAATFIACYFLKIPLHSSNVFTFLATLTIIQEPIRRVPDVIGRFIEAKVSLSRIVDFLEAPEMERGHARQKHVSEDLKGAILVKSSEICWAYGSFKPTLRNINLDVKHGEKVAICGEVGSGKSTLIATILGEVPYVNGTVFVKGKMAYVSQTAWIQTGTLQENILFGSSMDLPRYQEVLQKCSLLKDLELLPFGDLTEIGERGVNLSGGQRQRVQLARALYQNADVYLLDDPFSAVDAHTAKNLFNGYVMEALSGKTILLVTHQVEFLPAFDSVLLMSKGEILRTGTYDQLMESSQEFQDLVNSHHDTAFPEKEEKHASSRRSEATEGEIKNNVNAGQNTATIADQLIKQEEREAGKAGLKPYIQYLKHSKGFLFLSLSTLFHVIFIAAQLMQNYILAKYTDDSSFRKSTLIMAYVAIGLSLMLFLFFRSLFIVGLSIGASKSIFSSLMSSLFLAPMSFYDSTPLGRILSRVSFDMNEIDLDLPFTLSYYTVATITTFSSFIVLVILTWPVLFVIIPIIYFTVLLQRFYNACAKELMRISGTTKSLVANHLTESIAGSTTIRAFGQEDRFFAKCLELIDTNARPFFHSFSAQEWLLQRLEILCAIVLCSTAVALTSFHQLTSGFVGMSLSYGLSLNVFVIYSVYHQCLAENTSISIERVEQYMQITSEAPEVIENNRPASNWPALGRVEICDLKVRYRRNAPLVLKGISCIFEGGQKIGIVGRTGSGKTTLISTLFRLVEPTEGQIVIDGVNISSIGLRDLRSHEEIWKVFEKCQLKGAVQEKEEGLDSPVLQDGTNWSMGQRQLFCLGRALLKRSQILVLDEATASIDNATDSIIQKTIRVEFADCTVITVAHRIPTVMDCTTVLAISDGKLAEYDEPRKLMDKQGSLFGELVREYWSRTENARIYL
ncbi:Xenobiotic-transporting ATPase [Bertholletia excelsa]